MARSSNVVAFGTNRKHVCDFLLVISSNLGLILHLSETLHVFCSEQRHQNLGVVLLGLVADVVALRSEEPKLIIRVKYYGTSPTYMLTVHQR